MLIEHTFSRDQWAIREAKRFSERSKDPDRKVGCIIVRPDGTVASSGCNGLPMGIADTAERYADSVFKAAAVRHAEENAISYAKEPLDGCTLYVSPWQPCSKCAGAIIMAGIKRVVTDMSGLSGVSDKWQANFAIAKEMFAEAGVVLDHVPQPVVDIEFSYDSTDGTFIVAGSGLGYMSFADMVDAQSYFANVEHGTQIRFVHATTKIRPAVEPEDEILPIFMPDDEQPDFGMSMPKPSDLMPGVNHCVIEVPERKAFYFCNMVDDSRFIVMSTTDADIKPLTEGFVSKTFGAVVFGKGMMLVARCLWQGRASTYTEAGFLLAGFVDSY